MNKQELISMVAEKIDADCTQAGNVVSAVFDTVAQALSEGDKLVIPGFGTFATVKRAAHTARNPQTGEPIFVPERTVPVFRPGKALKDAVSK